MDTAIDIWNLLWDEQITIAVAIVLVIWLMVRGSDVFRWIFRKLQGKPQPPSDASNDEESSS